MRLSRVTMQGYKSFANRTEIAFPGAITAIVGPNGSGKSNVADALRWVLGEQSFSQLRSRRTADLIFAGTDGRGRVGMAEATIVLDNSDRSLPLDFAEVAISRRAYRSGENEYLINGVQVRLRDVAELLAQGGIDRLTFSVVGQGVVDAALSLSANERRRLFEEAAGITSHISKRDAALRQLEEAAGNMLRAQDIMRELEPQLRRLEGQAESARCWSDVQASLSEAQLRYYRRRLSEAEARSQASTVRARSLRNDLERMGRDLARLREQAEALAGQEAEGRAAVEERQREADEAWQALAAVEREQAVLMERERYTRLRLGQVRADGVELECDAESAAAEGRALERQAEGLLAEVETARVQVTALEQAQAGGRQRRREVEERLAQARRRLAAAMAAATGAQAQIDASRQRVEEIRGQLAGAKAAQAQAEAANREAADAGRQVAERLERAQATLAQAARSLEGCQTAAREAREALAQAQRQLREAQEEEQSLRARLQTLTRLRAESYYPAVREVMARSQELGDAAGVIGTVGSLLQVPEELERAIEATLGGRLQQVVVWRWSDAEQAIEHLKRRRDGRVTFLPLETIRPPRPVEPRPFDGLVGVAADLVGVERGLEPIREHMLNRLLIVRDLAAARVALDRVSGSFSVATLDGETAQSSGSVTGGSEARGRAALLEQERERRRLPEAIRQWRDTLAQRQEAVRAAQAGLAEAESAASAAQETASAARSGLDQAQAAEAAYRRRMAQVAEQGQWQERQLAGLRAELEEWKRADVVSQAKLRDARAEVEAASTEARATEDQLARMGDDGEQVLAAQRARLSDLREEVARVQAARQAAQDRAQRSRVRLAASEEQAEALTRELGETEAGQAAATQRRAQLVERLATAQDSLAPAREAADASQQQRRQLEQDERSRRQRQLDFAQVVGEAELTAGRHQDALEALLQAAEAEMDEPTFAALAEGLPAPGDDDEPMAELEARLEALRRRRRALGHVNPEAPREYEELRERFDFLTTQSADLEEASATLREVIAELEGTMKQRFTATFQEVSETFKVLFRELFSGGSAHLSLTDAEDPSVSGIDITVRPPGKRSQDLALLSGGERALTSVALLFALLTASGTPFCVLDEVDAMLDEANVGRFLRVLERLSTQTQIVLVSHNRRTIEAADVVYGVTMGEDGSSRLLSLRLGEEVAGVG